MTHLSHTFNTPSTCLIHTFNAPYTYLHRTSATPSVTPPPFLCYTFNTPSLHILHTCSYTFKTCSSHLHHTFITPLSHLWCTFTTLYVCLTQPHPICSLSLRSLCGRERPLPVRRCTGSPCGLVTVPTCLQRVRCSDLKTSWRLTNLSLLPPFSPPGKLVIESVLPLLLNKGMVNPAAEVRALR